MTKTLCAFLMFALVCGATFAAEEGTASPSPAAAIDITPTKESYIPAYLTLELQQYTFARRERRDPFRPALTPLAEGDEIIPAAQRPFFTPEEAERKLAEAQQLAQQITQVAAQGDHSGVVRYYKNLMQIQPKRFANEGYKNHVERLQSTLFDTFQKSQVVIITSQAEPILDSMEKLLERNEYKTVLQHSEEIEKLILGVGDPGPVAAAQLGELMLRALELRSRALARQEFEEKTIAISGIAWSPEAQFAIINGKTYAAGDMIEENLSVFSVEEHTVTFLFKGEQVSKGLPAVGVK